MLRYRYLHIFNIICKISLKYLKWILITILVHSMAFAENEKYEYYLDSDAYKGIEISKILPSESFYNKLGFRAYQATQMSNEREYRHFSLEEVAYCIKDEKIMAKELEEARKNPYKKEVCKVEGSKINISIYGSFITKTETNKPYIGTYENEQSVLKESVDNNKQKFIYIKKPYKDFILKIDTPISSNPSKRCEKFSFCNPKSAALAIRDKILDNIKKFYTKHLRKDIINQSIYDINFGYKNTSNDTTTNINDNLKHFATYRVSAQKKGYKKAWDDRDINIDSTKTLIVWGTVYDNQNKPLPFTKVTLAILGKIFTLQSDSNGDFKFEITINPNGNKVLRYNEDLHLKKPVSHISAQVLSNKLAANGKEQSVRVKFTDNNGVLADKKLYISTDNIPLTHNGSKASYAKFAYDSKYITTNGGGVADFTVHSPKAAVNLVNKYKDNKLFPISSSYHIYSLENGEKERVGLMKLNFYSPKPHITLRFPSGVKEGFWQNTPSKVYIDDLDSSHFKIAIRGYGRLKSQGSGVRYNKLIRQFDGKVFEFYFQPQKIGFDLNSQPKLWKKLLIVNRNALLSAFIPIAQNGKLPLKYPASSEFRDTIDYLVARAGAKDYHNLLQQVEDNKTVSYQTVMDGAVGGALLGDALNNIFMNKNVPLSDSLQLELLKAIYANASTVYGAYKDYNSIANAYEDVVPYHIMVTVIDDDGYKTVKQRSVFVKIWKRGK